MANCNCHVRYVSPLEPVRIVYCPLHASARKLLNVAKRAASIIEPSDDPKGRSAVFLKRLQKVIAEAEKKDKEK